MHYHANRSARHGASAQTFRLKPVAAAIAAVVGMAGAAGAHAQAALEEIVVTAQKESQAIQAVPISIQAFDAKSLEKSSITSLSDMKTIAPGLRILPNPTAQENLGVSIRGMIASPVELTQDNAAAVNLNGVYIARGNGMNMSVGDLERIEVLKGPQGTLYGRNSTAGALNVITVKPSNEFGFSQQLTFGNYGRVLAKTSLNLPVTDTFAARFNYLNDGYDGWLENSNGGPNFGERKAEGARMDLRWRPVDTVLVDYSYDYAKTKYSSLPTVCVNQLGAITPVGSTTPTPPQFSTALDPANCSTNRLMVINTPNPALWAMPPKNEVSNQGQALTVEWQPSSTMTLRSITAAREVKDSYYAFIALSPTTILGQASMIGATGPVGGASMPAPPDNTNDKTLTQEFQLIGHPSQYFSYNTGAFFYDEKGTENIPLGPSLNASPASALSAAAASAFGLGAGSWIGSLNGTRDVTVRNKSWAVYGQFSWTPDILDHKLDIVPGIRYTRDSRYAKMFSTRGYSWGYSPTTGVAKALTTTTLPVWIDGTLDRDFSKSTPALTLQYHADKDMMLYGKYVKGYKAGGVAIRSTASSDFAKGFGPESVASTELGVKSDWLEHRVRVNFDLFQSKITDQQISSVNSSCTTGNCVDVLNAGKSTYKGWELEAAAAVTDALSVGLNWTHTDFKFSQVLVNNVDVTRFYHMLVPKDVWALNLDYNFGRVLGGKLGLHVDYSRQDAWSGLAFDSHDTAGVQLNTVNMAAYTAPAYSLVNGRLSLNNIPVGPGSNGTLSVGLWGKNLTDKQYQTYANYLGVFSGTATNWGEPRTYGIDLIYRY